MRILPMSGYAQSAPQMTRRAECRVAVRPKNIEAILASVVPRPEATNLTSRGRSFVSASYRYETFPQSLFLAKYEGVALYTFPDPNSQLVYRLQKDVGYYGGRRVVEAGEPWIELSLHGKGEPGLFVREAAGLRQQVKARSIGGG